MPESCPRSSGSSLWLSQTLPGLCPPPPPPPVLVFSWTPSREMAFNPSVLPHRSLTRSPTIRQVPCTEMPSFAIFTHGDCIHLGPMPFAIHLPEGSPSPGPRFQEVWVQICLDPVCTRVSPVETEPPPSSFALWGPRRCRRSRGRHNHTVMDGRLLATSALHHLSRIAESPPAAMRNACTTQTAYNLQ